MSTRQNLLRASRVRLAVVFAATLAVATSVSAAEFTWIGGGADNNWSTDANWLNGARPTPASFPGSGTGTESITFSGTSGGISNIDIANASGDARINILAFAEGAGALTITSSENKRLVAARINLAAGTTVTIDTALGLSNGATNSNNIQGTLTLNGAISGNGFIKGSGGTVYLNNTNSDYTGPTTITQGTVVVTKLADGGANSSIGKGNSTPANGAQAQYLVLGNGASTSARLTYAGAGDSTNRLFTIHQSGGTIESAGAGAVQFTNTGTIAVSGAGERAFNLRGTNTGRNLINGSIGDSAGTGVLRLNKMDSGTWILGGANTYTGNTAISDGTLIVNGSLLATGDVTVSANARLSGNGSAGHVTASAGSIIAPGDGVGRLTVASMDLRANTVLELDLASDGSGTAGTDWDQLNVTGDLTLVALGSGNPLQIKLTTFTGAGEAGLLDSWDASSNHTWASIVAFSGSVDYDNAERFVVDADGFANTLNGVFNVVRNGNAFDLVYTAGAIPEPATCALISGLVMLGFIILRRRHRH
ncbi:autotransporter-associated beta strand repeat protein [Opitutaceae bacterium TAV1]|nr:autotransporter-associated beta strand repeat protein [Opitutaceae bacterium TAV1]